jgi:hypothetical protein
MEEITNTTETAIDANTVLTTVFRHRFTGEKMRIKKLKNGIATCESEIMRTIPDNTRMQTNIQICSLKNLIPCTE